MYPSVKELHPIENYILCIVFENGEKGFLDMKPYMKAGIFRKLQNNDIFNQVHVSFDTVEWECGVDLDPEFIYEKCVFPGSPCENLCTCIEHASS